MNLDDLISKYVDSELTPQEDSELRNILSEDNSAREAFDTDVFIHSAIKEEAKNIRPSTILLGETEDKILMKILANQPIVGDTVYPRKRRYAFATAVLAVMLFGFLRINDFQMFNDKTGMALILEQERHTLDKSFNDSQIETDAPEDLTMLNPREVSFDRASRSLLPAAQSIKENVAAETNSHSIILASSPAENAEYGLRSADNTVNTIATESVSEEFAPLQPMIQQNNDSRISSGGANIQLKQNLAPMPSNSKASNLDFQPDAGNSAVQLNPLPKQMIVNTQQPVGSMNMPNSFNQQNYYGNTTNIQLGSFFGTNLVNTGFDNTNLKNASVVSNFSQSIACEISKSQRVGLELGFTQFSFDDQRIGRIPSSGILKISDYSSSHPKIQEFGTGSDGTGITFPYTVNVNKQILWGSAFYEQVFVDFNKISITGRLGLGGTNDGLLSYARLYTQFDIFTWLSFTAGADGRYFKTVLNPQKSQVNDWKSSLSIIYGFKLKM